MSARRDGADPRRRPALRREGLPRHVDRRPRRGARACRRARSTRTSSRRPTCSGRSRARAPRPSTPRSTRCRTRGRSSSGSAPRCARTCASSPSSSTSRPSSCASGATSRASGASEFVAERRRYEERFRALFREGRERGELRTDLDDATAALLALSAANWAYTWLRPGADTDELADRFTALLLDGMRGYATRWQRRCARSSSIRSRPASSEDRLADGARASSSASPSSTSLLTERPRHATELVTDACRGGVDAVVVFSGDGGFNEALNGLESDVPIGFLPGGGTSVLCRARSACRAIPSRRRGRSPTRWPTGRTRRISLGRVNGRRFAFAPASGSTPRRCGGSTLSAGSGDGRRPGDLAFALGDRPRARGAARTPRAAARDRGLRPGGCRLRGERQPVHVRGAAAAADRARRGVRPRPRSRRADRGRAARAAVGRGSRPERPRRRPTGSSASTTSTGSRSAATSRCRCTSTARISETSSRPSSRPSVARSRCSRL